MEQFGLDATTTEYGFSQAPAYAQAEWRVADAALYPFASASQPALTVVAGRWRASKSDGTHVRLLFPCRLYRRSRHSLILFAGGCTYVLDSCARR
jgi:hypothetical protein